MDNIQEAVSCYYDTMPEWWKYWCDSIHTDLGIEHWLQDPQTGQVVHVIEKANGRLDISLTNLPRKQL